MAMDADEVKLRLECLKLAEAAKKAGDRRDLIAIAKEFYHWVKGEGGQRVKPAASHETAQSALPLGLPLAEKEKERPPTIKKMVVRLLEEKYPHGMTALQILAEIQKRWMPELMRTSLSPQLSRLKWDKEIVREHGVYRVSRQDAPKGEPNGASYR